MAGEADSFILLVLAVIFPPAAVGFIAGCGADLCLNILLTILGYLPGCIHAFWLVLKRTEANERYGYENWTYTGMGDYFPRDQGLPGTGPGPGPGPPPPPPPTPATTQYPIDKKPPQSQAPVEQKQAPVGTESTGYPGPPPQPPADQQGGYVPPPGPADQKQGGSTAPSGGN